MLVCLAGIVVLLFIAVILGAIHTDKKDLCISVSPNQHPGR
jgi:hypothetical protein